ncbi:hypothetical protein [Saccharothrix deserti]|uniref:hypothetical protein n=1 Tax=Saccharothrix deserti TaxID=2593674 RepID=UPI00131C0643|nr:hypothetical protein [Saccharothrix deserti]
MRAQSGGHGWFRVVVRVAVECFFVAFPGAVPGQPRQVQRAVVASGELVPDADDGRQCSLRLVVLVAGLVVVLQIEDDEGLAVALAPAAVHPPVDGDEAELASPVPREFDERGLDEVDGVLVLLVHFHDSPPPGQARYRSSTFDARLRSSRPKPSDAAA